MDNPVAQASAITTSTEVLIYYLLDIDDNPALRAAERSLRERVAYQEALAGADGENDQQKRRHVALARLYGAVADVISLEFRS